MRGAKPGWGDLHQGIIGHICQRFRKRTEKLGGIYPPHWQYQVNAYKYALVPWCRWDYVCKRAHLRRFNGAVVVRVCNVQFGHLDQTLDGVRLPYHL